MKFRTAEDILIQDLDSKRKEERRIAAIVARRLARPAVKDAPRSGNPPVSLRNKV